MNEIVKPAAAAPALPAIHRGALINASDLFADPDGFAHAQRVAKVFAASALIPKHFQGNLADCVIAIAMARRLNEEPMTVMQNLFVVNGRPGWSSAYMIARARRSGVFRGPVTWRIAGAGTELAVTAVAILSDTGEEVAVTTDMRMAKAEGWTKNPKYTSMPEHMLRWRSAAMLIRLYAPEVMFGLPVIEEVETRAQAEPLDVTPVRSAAEALDAFAAAAEASAARRGAEDVVDEAGAYIDRETGEILDEVDGPAAETASALKETT